MHDAFDLRIVESDAAEKLRGRLGLRDEHSQAARMRNAQTFGLHQDTGVRRVVYDIEHRDQAVLGTWTALAACGEGLEIADRSRTGGIHADRRRLDDQIGRIGISERVVSPHADLARSSMPFRLAFAVGLAVEHDDARGTLVTQHGQDGARRTSVAEDGRRPPVDVGAEGIDQVGEPVVIGVMPEERAIRALHDGIDASDSARGFGCVVDEGKRGDLIGNGHVHAVEGAAGEKGLELVFRDIDQIIGRRP